MQYNSKNKLIKKTNLNNKRKLKKVNQKLKPLNKLNQFRLNNRPKLLKNLLKRIRIKIHIQMQMLSLQKL